MGVTSALSFLVLSILVVLEGSASGGALLIVRFKTRIVGIVLGVVTAFNMLVYAYERHLAKRRGA